MYCKVVIYVQWLRGAADVWESRARNRARVGLRVGISVTVSVPSSKVRVVIVLTRNVFKIISLVYSCLVVSS